MATLASDSAPISAHSPCVGVCRLDHQGLCVGCRRSLDEIARWSQMNDAERRAVNEQCQCRQTPKVGQGMVV